MKQTSLRATRKESRTRHGKRKKQGKARVMSKYMVCEVTCTVHQAPTTTTKKCKGVSDMTKKRSTEVIMTRSGNTEGGRIQQEKINWDR